MDRARAGPVQVADAALFAPFVEQSFRFSDKRAAASRRLVGPDGEHESTAGVVHAGGALLRGVGAALVE